MFKKALCPVMSMLVLMVPVATWAGGPVARDIVINATVEEYFNWASATDTITIPNLNPGHLVDTGTLAVQWTSNVAVNVDTTATNAAVLSSGGDTLTTEYQLTGADLGGSADVAYITDVAFLAKTYTAASGVNKSLTFNVRATAVAGSVVHNDYTTTVTLTATW